VIFLITIQDKYLAGEPDVGLAVVEAADEAEALAAARPTIIELAEHGRGRCVPHARPLDPGKFYRLAALVRVPYDPNAYGDDETLTVRRTAAKALDLTKDQLPALPCPRCSHADTVPLRNYGRPMTGDAQDTSRWQCLECKHQFDGPLVRR
jgi:hypothetical protein